MRHWVVEEAHAVVVQVPANEAFALNGDFSVAVLRGCFDICGARLVRGSRLLPISAPFTASPPSITCTTPSDRADDEQLAQTPAATEDQQSQQPVQAQHNGSRLDPAVITLLHKCDEHMHRVVLAARPRGSEADAAPAADGGIVAILSLAPSSVALAFARNRVYLQAYKQLTEDAIAAHTSAQEQEAQAGEERDDGDGDESGSVAEGQKVGRRQRRRASRADAARKGAKTNEAARQDAVSATHESSADDGSTKSGSMATAGQQTLEPGTVLIPGLVVARHGTFITDELKIAVERLLAQDTADAFPVLLCGAKGAGKSTTLRYMANRLLSRFPRVALLDCDIGQAECTPPSLVSVVIVDEPLFSSPFTHIKTPAVSFFFGDVSPKDLPLQYAAAVAGAFEFYRQHYSDVPLLVNTMGWVKGLGQLLLGEVVATTHPRTIVELLLQRAHKNLDPPIEHGLPLLSRQPPPGYHRPALHHPVHTGPLRHSTIVKLQSTADTGAHSGNTALPSDLRGMAFASYFLAQGPLASHFNPLHEQPTYTVPFSAVSVVMFDPVPLQDALYALNGMVVGLSMMPSSAPHHMLQTVSGHIVRLSFSSDPVSIVGYGIVRAIDSEAAGAFHIITPIPYQWLQGVVTLVHGRLSLPQPLLLHQPSVPVGAPVPYTSNEFSDTRVQGRRARTTRQNLGRRRLQP